MEGRRESAASNFPLVRRLAQGERPRVLPERDPHMDLALLDARVHVTRPAIGGVAVYWMRHPATDRVRPG